MPVGKPRARRSPDVNVSRATSMRREQTEPERRLWRALRERIAIRGSHFRRQVCLGPYIVDFCCLGRRLVLEVDGDHHGYENEAAHDARRDEWLTGQGFTVLRFANRSVMTELDVVLDTIWSALKLDQGGTWGETPTPNPSPQGGGEQER